jgi:glycosyltransferase involved in cell wall biosynthesis
MSKKRILLINHYAGSNLHGMEYRPFYLAREWVRLGHEVTIVASSYSHVRTKPVVANGLFTEEYIDGIRYVWLKSTPYEGNGLLRVFSMLEFVSLLYMSTPKLLEPGKPDLVIAASTYLLDILPAHFVARKHGAKLVQEIRDLWPLTPMLLADMSKWHPFIMALHWIEGFGYRNADYVVSSLANADLYMKGRGMDENKFVLVPNGIDLNDWETQKEAIPQLHVQELSRLKEAGRFVVGYAGAHGLSNALDVAVDDAILLKEEPVSFVLVGKGPEKRRIQRKISEAGLTNMICLPPVPRAAIADLLLAMDVLYIGWKKTPLLTYGVSPNKLLDYMMAGRPVIHAVDGENDLVMKSCCGITVPSEDPSAVAIAVRKLMNMTADRRDAMGRLGRDYVTSHHDYRKLAASFLKATATN